MREPKRWDKQKADSHALFLYVPDTLSFNTANPGIYGTPIKRYAHWPPHQTAVGIPRQNRLLAGPRTGLLSHEHLQDFR